MTRHPTVADAINWDHAAEFSYAGHHSSAIDYVCLFRSDVLTLKAYFFDDGSDESVVVPHTHRYDFGTRVVKGSLEEVRYVVSDERFGRAHRTKRWRYDCVVDGGGGFTLDSASVWLRKLDSYPYEAARGFDRNEYFNRAHEDIHTLANVEPGTILLLTQYADRSPLHTYAWSREKPSADGLYSKMSTSELRERVEQLQEAMRAMEVR